MRRCFDCLEIIKPGDRRFFVLKPVGSTFSAETVCADCAGWYRDAVPDDDTVAVMRLKARTVTSPKWWSP